MVAGKPLTPRQVEVVDYLRESIETHRVFPTFQEIADDLLISKVTVFEHIHALERKGVVVRLGGARGFVLVGRCPACGCRVRPQAV